MILKLLILIGGGSEGASSSLGSGIGGSLGFGGSMDLSIEAKRESATDLTDSIGLGVSDSGLVSGG